MKTRVRARLVAFDVDGTLLDDRQQFHEPVISAIAEMQACGIVGCLVTGRMYRSALPFARRLKFDAPMVCYQGAAVIDPSSDDVLFDLPLPNAEVSPLIAYASEERLHLQLYKNDRFYCEQLNRWSRLYAKISGVEPIIVPSLEHEFALSDATKAVFVTDAQTAVTQLARIRKLLGERAYVTRSIPEFIEIMNPAVDKGKTLEIVARHLGFEMSEVVAIGDSWNDAPLLRVAGFGIAMGSAPQELRDVADAVVADVAHDGVAEAIERFVLT